MAVVDEGVLDLARGDAGLALAGRWGTGGPEEQQRAADAAVQAWLAVPWPPGLLAYSCFLGVDGASVLHYSQWTDEDASRAFASAGRPQWVRAVDLAAPGVRHLGVRGYRWYRSTPRASGAAVPGCVVTVSVAFDRRDPGLQRDWIDGVFAAGGGRPPGMVAAHFHLSTDGTGVLNIAEWATPQAHSVAAGQPAPELRAVTRDFPGVASLAVRQHIPYRAVRPGPAA